MTSLTGSYKERRLAFTPVLICLRAHPVWGEEEAVGRALALTPTSSQRSQRGRWCHSSGRRSHVSLPGFFNDSVASLLF